MPTLKPGPEDDVSAELNADRLFHDFVMSMRAHLEATAHEFGFTPVQARALRMLGEPRPMRSLAASLQCDASYITAIADHLEGRGLIERQADPGDRRVKRLVLTPGGHALRTELIEALASGSPLVRELSELDPEERKRVIEFLERVGSNIDTQWAQPEAC